MKHSGKILCLGLSPAIQRILEFDQFKENQVNRAVQVTECASGKATNTARTLHCLGSPYILFGFGSGHFSRLLKEEDIAHHLIDAEADTRVCQSILSRETGTSTELVEEMPQPGEAEWALLKEAFLKIIPGCAGLLLCGSPPPGTPSSIYRELIELAHKHNCWSLVDSQKDFLKEALAAKPLIAKCNQDEFATTFPSYNIKHLSIDHPDTNLLISQGAEPCKLAKAGEVSSLAVKSETDIISTIGCGDAMNAGIAKAVSEGKDILEAVDSGIRCGELNTQTRIPGLI